MTEYGTNNKSIAHHMQVKLMTELTQPWSGQMAEFSQLWSGQMKEISQLSGQVKLQNSLSSSHVE